MIKHLRSLQYKDADIFNNKLKGITDLGKLVGKKIMTDFEIGGFIIKPEGKPTLVPETDKRPEIQSQNSAAEDFGE